MKPLFRHFDIGHFINQPQNPTAFEIMRFGEMDEPDVDDIHRHTFYEIIWIEKGESRQTIDYKAYDIGPGTFFFISPGQVHEFEAWKPLEGGSILFTADFFLLHQLNHDKLLELTFLDNFFADASFKPVKADFIAFLKTINWLEEEQKSKHRNERIVQSLLHILLAQVQRAIEKQSSIKPSRRYVVVYKQFRQLLEEYYNTPLTTAGYADKLNITQHHLNHICREVTSRTATDVIRARSILEAQRLLTFTSLSISEIAAQLNYFDSSYFAKLFKKETGYAPAAFRNAISEKYRI
jgi:AraC family transcriptional regulator, transcriptional activator of pobA